MKNIRFVTALDLIKCLKRLHLTYATISEQPSNIGTMGQKPENPIKQINFANKNLVQIVYIYIYIYMCIVNVYVYNCVQL